MRLEAPLICLAVLTSIYAFAADSLVVRNLSVDHDKQELSFEIVNVSGKSVHSWTMTVVSKKRPPADNARKDVYTANMLTTSEACSGGAAAALGAGASRRCEIRLFSGESATVVEAAVMITSVLFDDGSAEGDVALLDNLSRERRSTIRFLGYWIGQLSPALTAPTPREQLLAMEKALTASESELPADLRYDPTATREHENLLRQVRFSLQALDTPKVKDARAQAIGTVEGLRQRLNWLGREPEPFFPRREADLATPAGDSLANWKVIARTTALQLVAVRESSGPMKTTTLFLQNVSNKRITAIRVANGDFEKGGNGIDWFGAASPAGVLPGVSYPFVLGSVTERTLSINAVVFEDGTGDGVQSEIDSINYMHLGRMFEVERIRGILEAAGSDLATLTAKLDKLPQSSEETIAQLEEVKLPGVTIERIRAADSSSIAAFFGGVHTARQRAKREIADLAERKDRPGASLEDFRRQIREESDRDRAYCARVYVAK